jgi:hypothetical protein
MQLVVADSWATSGSMTSNEKEMSDGWRDGASLRVEGGISLEN